MDGHPRTAASLFRMRVEKRNLFVTLRMLRTAGIAANTQVIGDRLHVFLAHPERGKPPLRAAFGGSQLMRAADWLAACVIRYYPQSDLAKVWSVILSAAATLPR